MDNSYSQDHDLYVIAKLKVKPPTPKPSPTPPKPQPSNSNDEKTEIMVSGFTETVTLKKGQEIIYEILNSKKSVIQFKTNFIYGGSVYKPNFYVGFGYEPNKYVNDAMIVDGNGKISNKKSLQAYLVISNTDSYALDCKFTITPNITKFSDYDNNSVRISTEVMIGIVAPIVGVILLAFIVLVIAVIVRQRHRKNDMNVQLMNNAPYYNINTQY